MAAAVKFYVSVRVNREFLQDNMVEVDQMAREVLEERARHLRGPRGGRYEAVEPVRDIVLRDGVEFDADRVIYRGTVLARYVRPKRGAA